MPEHPIRLRRAWTLESPLGSDQGTLDLPADRLDLVAPFRLRRAWNVPASLTPDEVIELRLERIPGLVSVEIDGLPHPPAPRLVLSPAAGRRSRIVLTCDPSDLTESQRRDWGHIQLVFNPEPPRAEPGSPTPTASRSPL